ncbi:hypothetical protein AAFF_G00188130 [Aldrovandia affinis]|uniref:Uncharacterized protein n=1 Tax=Aldrovandia affinis TaxID=143900 RepID=A0AAD7T028_9TELE|nr:hypothetical protein AAFF_G00188130 [Aldrovandia affinis]
MGKHSPLQRRFFLVKATECLTEHCSQAVPQSSSTKAPSPRAGGRHRQGLLLLARIEVSVLLRHMEPSHSVS